MKLNKEMDGWTVGGVVMDGGITTIDGEEKREEWTNEL